MSVSRTLGLGTEYAELTVAPAAGRTLALPDYLVKAYQEAEQKLQRQRRRARQESLTGLLGYGTFFTEGGQVQASSNPGGGLEKPRWTISHSALRAASRALLIDRLIIDAIKLQARRFAQICDVPGVQKGFRVVHRRHKDPNFDSDTDDIRRRCAEMEELLRHPTKPPHSGFRDWLITAIEDQLVLDRRAMVKVKNRGGGIASFHQVDGACYSADTEVLTRRGWLRFDQVDLATDEFATRNQGSHEFEWQRAFYFHEETVDGEAVRFRSRTLDLLVTPNHRMVARYEGSKSERIVPAREFVGSTDRNWMLPATSEWVGEEIAEITIPAISPNALPVVLSGDDYAAFMGMYLAEGSAYALQDTVTVTQAEGSKGFTDYRDLLERVFGRVPHYDGKNFRIKRASLCAFLEQFGHATEKYIPADILGMTKRQLAIFWRYYMLGDGHYEARTARTERGAARRPAEWAGRQRVATSSKRMADGLQEVAQKLGYSASVRQKKAARDARFSDGRVIKAENAAPQYVVALRTTRYQRFTATAEHYTGKVYCVSVPNEVLYVRRNGQPIWCGNTIQPRLQVLAEWMLRHPATGTLDNAFIALQAALYRKPPADPQTGRTRYINLDRAAFVQVVNGEVTDAWTEEEMEIGIANPSNAIDHWGYGTSPLEASMLLGLMFNKAINFNMNLFDTDFPEAIIAVRGDYNQQGLAAFKRAIQEFDPGEGGLRLPIIDGEDIEMNVVPMREAPREMQMVEMIVKVANLVCGFYGVHPGLINISEEGGQIQIGYGSDSQVEQAVGTGFHVYLLDQAHYLDTAIVQPIYPDLTTIVEGLDVESEQARIAREQHDSTFMTFNESRKMKNLPPIAAGIPKEIGDFAVNNPGYMGAVQVLMQAQQAEQMAQQQGMAAYEQGNFGGPQEGQEGPPGQAGPGQSEGDDPEGAVKQGWQQAQQGQAGAGGAPQGQPSPFAPAPGGGPPGGPPQGAPPGGANPFAKSGLTIRIDGDDLPRWLGGRDDEVL